MSGITIVGLGPAGLGSISLEALQALESAPCLLLRTARHPAAAELAERGIPFTSLDPVYESAPSFAELYDRLAGAVLERLPGDVVYAVPGHPLIAEESVRILLERARGAGISVRILPAASFLDAVLAALAAAGEIVAVEHLQIVDATALPGFSPSPDVPAILYQVDDAVAASSAKLALMERYRDDHPVAIVRRAGIPGAESVARVPLYEMDRPAAGAYDHLTSVYLPAAPLDRQLPGQQGTHPGGSGESFEELVEVIARLRAPDGCPWDREQTYETLKRFVIEEAYELIDAVDSRKPAQLRDELGDLMIQVLLYAQLAKEDGDFAIGDVVANTVEKLVRRHPHVFGDEHVETSAEVLKNWERIKREERPERESVLDSVPRHLPALMKATEVSKRVARVGFEWPGLADVFAKLEEEIGELREAQGSSDPIRQRDEVGDLLFTLVNIARWLKIDPEDALRVMVERFTRRFQEVERLAREAGKPLMGMGIPSLNALWEQAKEVEP